MTCMYACRHGKVKQGCLRTLNPNPEPLLWLHLLELPLIVRGWGAAGHNGGCGGLEVRSIAGKACKHRALMASMA